MAPFVPIQAPSRAASHFAMIQPSASLLAQARPLFETPPPDVSAEDAVWAARRFYGMKGSVTPLTGERDRNFLIRPADGSGWVLKFINAAEPDAEAGMQAAVLDHLNREIKGLAVPRHRPTREGEALFCAVAPSGRETRGRCYSFLPGDPALKHGIDDIMRRSVGRAAALIDRALRGFRHPAAARLNLWDLCHVGELAELAEGLAPAPMAELAVRFLDHFKRITKPRMAGLRRQAIHNDLSRSNMVVDPNHPGEIAGVLDFGDMIEAPLLSELAVAASYQLAGDAPLEALRTVVSGFNGVTPLEPLESALLLDFVLARLVDRILISEWRARQFPENSAYILRSNQEARDLMAQLMPVWSDADRDWHAFFQGKGTRK